VAIALCLLALGLPALAWAVAQWHLRGEDLRAHDQPTGERFRAVPDSRPALDEVLAQLAATTLELQQHPHLQRRAALRRSMDAMFSQRVLGVTEQAATGEGLRATWVTAPGADPRRRTLFIHGGAFYAGSPQSHRTLSSRFAELTGGAVLAVDYRLMPEHPRRAGIDDCRQAYRWLLENGPDGATPADCVVVAGDSAGGNLALSLIAWVRDEGLRPPDAVVAICPATDATLSSPSLERNLATDPMLGPMFGHLAKVPRWLLRWGSWLYTRINPRDPLVSPVYGDLSRLPPVLVQASEQEMLYDDSRRYVNRARAAGSPVRLQTWVGMPHVWHIFNPELPEARAALDEIGSFLAEAMPAGPPAGRPAPGPA
jgi:acetyl esterase/lipase